METIDYEPKEKSSTYRAVYPIKEPYVYVAIVRDPISKKIKYEVIEPTLLQKEEEKLIEIKAILLNEIDVNLKDLETREKATDFLQNKIREVIKDYHISIAKDAVDKLTYFIMRDFIGYGKIDSLMHDHLIEDISADGVNIPVYVWHRKYESLPTNILFKGVEELNSFVVRLAYFSGRHISIANPMLEATLPDGSRIHLTYGSEVTRRGPTFTIRRFRVDPLTISDLISFNTLSPNMAAYFWYIIENRASVLISGGVAAGKTTMLNCLSMFIKPEFKIVSVEDTAELNLPHENWIPSVTRIKSGSEHGGAEKITLFDLLKAAVRQRPEYIIVGEIRGEEAYTLFQAMAMGHLGMSTIHAESVNAVIQRLASEPMNIPKDLLKMIDAVTIQLRTEVGGNPARRTSTVMEVVDFNPKTNEFLTNEVYTWDVKRDVFLPYNSSHLLEKIMKKKGLKVEEVQEELHQRRVILEWMAKNKIRKYTDVAAVIREYYANPTPVYRKAMLGMS